MILQEHNMDSFESAAQMNMDGMVCWLMDAEIARDMFIANIVIGVSYFVISGLLVLLARTTWDLLSRSFKLNLGLFSFFILFCGIGHIIKVLNIWEGMFRLELAIDIATAVISVIEAVFLTYGMRRFTSKVKLNKSIFDSNFKDVLVLTGVLALKNKKPTTALKRNTLDNKTVLDILFGKSDLSKLFFYDLENIIFNYEFVIGGLKVIRKTQPSEGTYLVIKTTEAQELSGFTIVVSNTWIYCDKGSFVNLPLDKVVGVNSYSHHSKNKVIKISIAANSQLRMYFSKSKI
ncbi:hypothetical protein Molly4_65 [Maribacter phage Molly_4]|nr:hypothetical protein Molly4_65 [Maribacter phage Molly_4]